MRIAALGDNLMSITPPQPDPGLLAAWQTVLLNAPVPGQRDVVIGRSSLVVHYDPLAVPVATDQLPADGLAQLLETRLAPVAPLAAGEREILEIPVHYGGPRGIDLEAVAAHAGLTPADVIDRHSAATYIVEMIGFLPGFAYLAGLDPILHTPRHATPRPRIAAGSVAIGGDRTAVYPLDSPGGWQIIGWTPLVLFAPNGTPPARLRAGMGVRFVPQGARP